MCQSIRKIDIGDNELIVSNVQIYSAAHPVKPEERLPAELNPEKQEYFIIAAPMCLRQIGQRRLVSKHRFQHPLFR